MGQDDVLQPLQQFGREFHFHPGLAGELVTEDDVALQNAAAAAFRGERALVFDHLAGVVQQDAGHREVRMHFAVEGQQRFAGAGHVCRVLQQTVAIGVVHRDGGG